MINRVQVTRRPAVRVYFDGVRAFFGGVGFIVGRPRMWGWALIPATVATLLFGGLGGARDLLGATARLTTSSRRRMGRRPPAATWTTAQSCSASSASSSPSSSRDARSRSRFPGSPSTRSHGGRSFSRSAAGKALARAQPFFPRCWFVRSGSRSRRWRSACRFLAILSARHAGAFSPPAGGRHRPAQGRRRGLRDHLRFPRLSARSPRRRRALARATSFMKPAFPGRRWASGCRRRPSS